MYPKLFLLIMGIAGMMVPLFAIENGDDPTTLAEEGHASSKPSSIPGKAFINQQAPAFSVKDTHGKTVDLKTFNEKIVVLHWVNHECAYDRKHHAGPDHNIQTLEKNVIDKGGIWITIMSSTKGNPGYKESDQKANHGAEFQGTFPTHLIRDEKGDLARLYGVRFSPYMIILDKKGKIAYMGALDSINSTKVADISRAEPYFIKALEEVIAGHLPVLQQTEPYGCAVK